MDQLTSSPKEILDAELTQLYRRRFVIDELILCLEKYADCTSKVTAGIPEPNSMAMKAANAL
jgi:hypothetical protein